MASPTALIPNRKVVTSPIKAKTKTTAPKTATFLPVWSPLAVLGEGSFLDGEDFGFGVRFGSGREKGIFFLIVYTPVCQMDKILSAKRKGKGVIRIKEKRNHQKRKGKPIREKGKL